MIVKKNEWILVLGILVLVGLTGAFLYGRRTSGAWVTVQVDGEDYGRYSLGEDQVIEIGETNRLEIKEGKASITYGNCPDQICVETGAIGRAHEVIVCMPNRVVVEITD